MRMAFVLLLPPLMWAGVHLFPGATKAYSLLLPPVVLLCAVIVAILVLRVRARWRTVGLLAAAGFVSGVLWVVVSFVPIRQMIFPFQYEASFEFMGNQYWEPLPIEVPEALLDTITQSAPEYHVDSPEDINLVFAPETVQETTPLARTGPGLRLLPAIAYYDPNYSCAVPRKHESTQAPPPDPRTIQGVRIYTGFGALLFYAFGDSGSNAILRGAFFTIYHGGACAVILLLMRRLSRSPRQRAAIGAVDRSRVLVRAAGYSVWWPAVVVLLHAFFWTLNSAGFYAKNTPGLVVGLPLALGWAGVGGIWLGGILGHALTIHAVAGRAAHIGLITSNAESVCPFCEYPKRSPNDRCSECGCMEHSDSSRSSYASGGRRFAYGVAKWALVVLLLCAPITLPLIEALRPF